MKKAIVAVGDAGAAEYFVPILGRLPFPYRIVADPNGVGKNVLARFGIEHELADTVSTNDAAAIICGTAGKAQALWRNATIAGTAARIHVAWMGDFFGSGCEPGLQGLSPNYMGVFDEGTGDLFATLKPEVLVSQIQVIGNPSFDAIAKYDVAAAREKNRVQLGVPFDATLVCYSGSSFTQFEFEKESLGLIVPWILERGYYFSLRFHPADMEKHPARVKAIREGLRGQLGDRFVDPGSVRGLEYAAAADLFVTDYSTEGVKSTIAGIPTAFMLLDSAQAYQRSRGRKFPYFPILESEFEPAPATLITSSDEVAKLDATLEAGSTRQITRERFPALADGKATERAITFLSRVWESTTNT